MKITRPLLVLACLGLCVPASAQGADDCNSAQLIAGLGIYNFDNTAATVDGVPDPLCLSFSQDDISFDVWFAWTAPSDGIFILDTCGQTSVDSKIGVYDGSCTGTILACNDDACALQSQVSWAGTTGSIYYLRVGTYPLATAGGTGTFTVWEDVPQEYTTNGHYYQIIRQAIPWSAAKAAAESMFHLGVQGHLATLTSQGENDFVFSLGNADNCWIGGFQNTSSPAYSEPGGGWEWITGEPWVYTNWGGPEPNDTSGIYPHEDFVELLSSTVADDWNDAHPDEHPAGYVVEFPVSSGAAFCFGDGSAGGTCPCGNLPAVGSGEGCYNVTGVGAKLAASGLASVANDTLTLTVTQAAPDDFGIFVQNITLRTTPAAFYNGLFCLEADSHLVRHYAPPAIQPTVTNSAGMGVNAQALTIGDFLGDTQPGVTVHYQFWGRDNGGPCGFGANFSSGLSIIWVP